MLVAVEGGGFFSSSASGYSKGLAFLLLGQSSEERPMRVLPLNQYQSVEQKSDTDLQLASKVKRASRGCTSFICFNRASAGADEPPRTKAAIVSQSVTLPDSCSAVHSPGDENERKFSLKSSLKKPCSSTASEGVHASASIKDMQRSVSFTERRKVQWTDSCGGELAAIREFEASDDDSSDDEFEYEGSQGCECVIQ